MLLLSIVLPTLNGGEILKESLPLLAEQVKRNRNDVELIVCDNASDDDTLKTLEDMRMRDPFFKIVHFDERKADIGDSIARAAECGEGEYIHFWSDDDIPSPFMVDAIINALRKYKDAGVVMMNRMRGFGNKFRPLLPLHGGILLDCNCEENEIVFNSVEDFIKRCFRYFGFLGAFVVRRSAYKKGMAYYDKENLGYQFQAPILCGLTDRKCIYLNYPLLIQRSVPGRYAPRWPLYLYIGYPRMCRTVERAGVVSNWRIMYDHYRFFDDLRDDFWRVIHLCIPNKELYLPYVDEMVSNQCDWRRRAILRLIRAPKWGVFIVRCFWWLFVTSPFGRFFCKFVQYFSVRLHINKTCGPC